MMHSRPLTIHIGHENIILEQICPACEGTDRWHPDLSLPCDFCRGGYVPSFEGITILQFVSIHFGRIMPNVAVLNELTDRFTVRAR